MRPEYSEGEWGAVAPERESCLFCPLPKGQRKESGVGQTKTEISYAFHCSRSASIAQSVLLTNWLHKPIASLANLPFSAAHLAIKLGFCPRKHRAITAFLTDEATQLIKQGG